MRKHTEFEGPSPDEIAILKASKDYCGFLLKGADSRICTLVDKNNEKRAIGLCSKSVIYQKGFLRGNFTCKKKQQIKLLKKRKTKKRK